MSEIKTGGPAFPMPEQQFPGGMDGYYGMTLRDYFAAKAMQAALVTGDDEVTDLPVFLEWAARNAYAAADAMLRAREAK